MANQIVVSAGAKVRNLSGVLTATSGVVSSLPIDGSLGIPQLDINGKILVSQLPNSVMEYKGTWNAATNTPTLANGTGNQGDVYLCNVAGTVDFGAGPIAFVVGDQVIYSGSIWQRASGATGTVTSVAITESGDSLNITGSPITTSGTINIGFNGTNLQYVNGAGNLTTFPTLTGYVPYTGATGDVNLGLYSLTSNSIKVIGDNSTYGGTLSIKQSNVTSLIGVGYTELFGKTNRLGISFGAGSIALLSNSTLTAERTYTLPDANGTIALTSDIPILTGYVPYTGATTNVDLGVYDLTADLITGARGSFASNGGSDTFAINHSSGGGIALNITKGGAGEGLYINKTSGSGNAATIIGTLEATTLVKSGGTSSQFLKADGTVDSNTYALDSLVVHLAGTETIAGAKTFSGLTSFTFSSGTRMDYGPYLIKGSVPIAFSGSTTNIYSDATTNNIVIRDNLSIAKLEFNNSTQTYTFPAATGTVALTSDISYPVTSVFGRTGAVVATSGDYTTTQVTEGTNLYYTDVRARAALSFVAGSGAYNSTTGVITIPTDNNQIANGAGYITLSSLSATSPIFYNSTTGVISSQAASATLEGYVTTGTQTFAGLKTFNDAITANSGIAFLNGVMPPITSSYYSGIGGNSTGISIIYRTGGGTNYTNNLNFPASNNSYSFPSSGGTLALTTDLSGYLPLTGGTLTGALNGTSAIFSSSVQGDFLVVGTTAATSGGLRLGTQVAIRARNVANTANIPLIESTASDGVSVSNGALILASTGAATFSSSVTAKDYTAKGGYGGSFTFYDTITSVTTGGIMTDAYWAANNQLNTAVVAGAGNSIKFYTNNSATASAIITSGGNVGIGTSSPTYLLDVNKSVAGDHIARFYNTSATGYGVFLKNADNTKPVIRAVDASDNIIFDVKQSGVTATAFFESSSIKGKDIIATNPLLALDIDVIKYTRKSDESKDIRYGYSAEQIHSLMPELTDKDVTAVKYLDVHTILISQLQKEIKELKAKLN